MIYTVPVALACAAATSAIVIAAFAVSAPAFPKRRIETGSGCAEQEQSD
jgi:hypothetical protein